MIANQPRDLGPVAYQLVSDLISAGPSPAMAGRAPAATSAGNPAMPDEIDFMGVQYVPYQNLIKPEVSKPAGIRVSRSRVRTGCGRRVRPPSLVPRLRAAGTARRRRRTPGAASGPTRCAPAAPRASLCSPVHPLRRRESGSRCRTRWPGSSRPRGAGRVNSRAASSGRIASLPNTFKAEAIGAPSRNARTSIRLAGMACARRSKNSRFR